MYIYDFPVIAWETRIDQPYVAGASGFLVLKT